MMYLYILKKHICISYVIVLLNLCGITIGQFYYVLKVNVEASTLLNQ